MLSFACPQCSKPLKVGPDLFGKKVKCPGCGHWDDGRGVMGE